MAKKNYYVNNKDLLAALIEYKKQLKEAEENNFPKPNVPDFIGECILKIATHLSYRPNFLNYPFREDMIGDGIENCLVYINNFDPDRFQNPFAYFTQIMWYAFVRRILKEKKQLYVKYKCIQNSNEFSDYVNQASDDKEYKNTYVEFLRQNMTEIISEFEEKKQAKRKKKNPNSLEKFFGPSEDEVVPEPIAVEEDEDEELILDPIPSNLEEEIVDE